MGEQICSAGEMVNGFETDGRFSLSTTTPLDSSLIIDNVTMQDSGFYSCRVTEHGILRTLHLNVSGNYKTFINVHHIAIEYIWSQASFACRRSYRRNFHTILMFILHHSLGQE